MTSESIVNRIGFVRAARRWMRRAMAASFSVLLLVGLEDAAIAQAPQPQPELKPRRIISLDAALIETVQIESRVQGWTLRKLCIDGQAYWIGFSETNPTGISPAYKNGKAEQCTTRTR